MPITLTVNGQRRSIDVDPDTPLLWVIRDTLGLANVEVIQARAESYKPETRYETVVARAVGPLADLVRFAGPLLAPGGRLLAMKGQRPERSGLHDEGIRVGNREQLVHGPRLMGSLDGRNGDVPDSVRFNHEGGHKGLCSVVTVTTAVMGRTSSNRRVSPDDGDRNWASARTRAASSVSSTTTAWPVLQLPDQEKTKMFMLPHTDTGPEKFRGRAFFRTDRSSY